MPMELMEAAIVDGRIMIKQVSYDRSHLFWEAVSFQKMFLLYLQKKEDKKCWFAGDIWWEGL